MKIRHINSSNDDFIEYTEPIFLKQNGIYGNLIIDIHRKVWVIPATDFYSDPIEMTEEFIIED